MKITYQKQMIFSGVIVILSNILSTILKHWVYRSIGFGLCGLLWIINPVLPRNLEPTKKNKNLLRIAGVILIAIGIFTRSYIN